MTVSSKIYINQFNGDDSTVDFVGNFKIPDEESVLVVTTDTSTGIDSFPVLNTDYTITLGVNNFTATFNVAPASGLRVTLLTYTPALQNASYVENDAFPATTTEDALDYLATAVRTLQAQINRTPIAPEGTLMSGFSNILPPFTVDNSGRAIILNDTADGFDLSDVDLTSMGDVTGPNSSTDNAIARFDGTTGLNIQNSLATISDDGTLTLNSGSATAELRLGELSGSNYTGFRAPNSLVSDVMYTMPTTAGSNGQVLATTGGGVLEWVDANDESFEPWIVVTANGSLTNGFGHLANSASHLTLTLPATCAVGTRLEVAAMGAGGFTIAQNSGQTIRFGEDVTTTGISGLLQSTEQGDVVKLVCSVANQEFMVVSSIGNLTLV